MAKTITIKGLDRVLNRVAKMPERVKVSAYNEVKKGAFAISAQAVRNIKSNDSIGVSGGGGGLIGSQTTSPFNDGSFIGFEVLNTAPYAPFVEFGTGARAKVPADWADYAATFKGKSLGQGGDTFFQSIVKWVRAKGLSGRYSVKTRRRLGKKDTKEREDEAVAWPIYISILKNGSYPHPFLYPAYMKEKDAILKNVIQAVNKSI